jgi:Putative DNA-binding domain
MGARVRIGNDGYPEVVGHGEIVRFAEIASRPRQKITYGTLEGVGPAYLHSLRLALIKWRRAQGDPKSRVWLGLARVSEEEFHSKLETMDPFAFGYEVLNIPPDASSVPPGSPALLLEGERLFICIEAWRKKRPQPAAVRQLLEPFAQRHGASCAVTVKRDERHRGFTVGVKMERSPPRGATVADAWKLGDEARALMSAARGGELKLQTALDLLRAGRWDLFRGQPESAWLEAKKEPYANLKKKGKYELAKDVAAFANSPQGGIIVLGMRATDKGDGDTIRYYRTFDLDLVSRQQYRSLVAHWVYPLVRGFEVERIEGSTPGRGLVVLVVPQQPESSRPFLVQGLYSQGGVLGKHVLLPERREDEIAQMDAAALHARIRLGEQVIAGKRRI